MKDFYRALYQILYQSISTKDGGTDHISAIHKHFIYYVGKKVKVKVARFIFDHMCKNILQGITTENRRIHHCRLLSFIFAQTGFIEAVKPSFPGYDKILNKDPPVLNAQSMKKIKVIKEEGELVTTTKVLHLSRNEFRYKGEI
jgi:hypothetical protein